jgi:hypothetical protein
VDKKGDEMKRLVGLVLVGVCLVALGACRSEETSLQEDVERFLEELEQDGTFTITYPEAFEHRSTSIMSGLPLVVTVDPAQRILTYSTMMVQVGQVVTVMEEEGTLYGNTDVESPRYFQPLDGITFEDFLFPFRWAELDGIDLDEQGEERIYTLETTYDPALTNFSLFERFNDRHLESYDETSHIDPTALYYDNHLSGEPCRFRMVFDTSTNRFTSLSLVFVDLDEEWEFVYDTTEDEIGPPDEEYFLDDVTNHPYANNTTLRTVRPDRPYDFVLQGARDRDAFVLEIETAGLYTISLESDLDVLLTVGGCFDGLDGSSATLEAGTCYLYISSAEIGSDEIPYRFEVVLED